MVNSNPRCADDNTAKIYLTVNMSYTMCQRGHIEMSVAKMLLLPLHWGNITLEASQIIGNSTACSTTGSNWQQGKHWGSVLVLLRFKVLQIIGNSPAYLRAFFRQTGRTPSKIGITGNLWGGIHPPWSIGALQKESIMRKTFPYYYATTRTINTD